MKGQHVLTPILALGHGEAPHQPSHAALTELRSFLSQLLGADCTAGSDSFRSSYALEIGPKPPIRCTLHNIYTPCTGTCTFLPLPPCHSWPFLQLHRTPQDSPLTHLHWPFTSASCWGSSPELGWHQVWSGWKSLAKQWASDQPEAVRAAWGYCSVCPARSTDLTCSWHSPRECVLCAWLRGVSTRENQGGEC